MWLLAPVEEGLGSHSPTELTLVSHGSHLSVISARNTYRYAAAALWSAISLAGRMTKPTAECSRKIVVIAESAHVRKVAERLPGVHAVPATYEA
jgi:hypothetical protein